jgi:predicted phosphodiesterase
MLKSLGKIENRLLIFGGPYSNLASTEAMRSKAEELGIDSEHTICTGDLVAYCAEPRQTVDLIRDWGIHVVMGNCEESLAREQLDCGCGFEEGSLCSTLSIAWYEYANQHINHDSRRWMSELPRSITFRIKDYRFKVVHASVTSINQFVFPSTSIDIKRREITEADADAVIGGHSGIPFGQVIEDKVWLNAGVIGLPANDGSTDGWYMLLGPVESGFLASWHRLQYDANISCGSTLAAGMTEYAQALTSGMWPSMDILPAHEIGNQGKRLDPAPLKIDLD